MSNHPSPFEIRAAAAADVPALFRMKLQLAASEGDPRAVQSTEAEWLRDGFGADRRFAALVAAIEPDLVGMITFTELYLTALCKPTFYIVDLFVDPAHRRHGVGRALVRHVAAAAVRLGIPLIQLGMRQDNPAAKFYQDLGFQPLGRYDTYVVAGPPLLDLATATTGLLSI